MEHHSFWINSCIGHHNQKYYLLFLFYGTLSGIGAALLFTWVIINVFFEVHLRAPLADTTHATQPSHSQDIKEGQVDNVAKYALKKNVIGINLAIVVPATFAFLAMLLLQGSHLLQNTTTLGTSFHPPPFTPPTRSDNMFYNYYNRGMRETESRA